MNIMRLPQLRGIVLIPVFFLLGCATKAPTGRDAWKSVLSNCTSTEDLPKSRMLYFGPSNPIGPGSVWAPKDKGGYGLRFSLDRAIPLPADRAKLITNGIPATCDGVSRINWTFKPSLTFSSTGTPIEGELGVAFDQAEDVKVSVKSWRVDRLEEFDYETWAKSPSAGGYGDDLLGTNWHSRFFMDAAIAVSGFAADLTFQGKIAGELKAKYPNPSLTLGANFTGSWTGDRTLRITSTNEFYVAGSLSPVKAPGRLGMFTGAAPKRRIDAAPIKIPNGAEFTLDEFTP